MDVAIGLLKVFMKRGVVDEMVLTPLFEYFFNAFPELSLEKRMEIFIDITQMKRSDDYPNTWTDLEFPVDDDSGMPIHPSFS